MGSGQPEGQQLGSPEGERGALLGVGARREGSLEATEVMAAAGVLGAW